MTEQPMRVRGLVSGVKQVQARLASWAASSPEQSSEVDLPAALQPVQTQIRSLVDQVEVALGTQGAVLPEPSRRAYQWATYLAHEPHFIAHSHAVQKLWARLACHAVSPSAKDGLFLCFEYSASLYRLRRERRRSLSMAVNEGYVHAPEAVLQALADVAMLRHAPQARQRLRRYASTDAFRQVLYDVEHAGLALRGRSVGSHHALKEAFARVNARYFQGMLAAPGLQWGARRSYRKLGHYDPGTDILQVSPALDQKDVPEFVIEYVIYHELLHKQLGIRWHNGRRHAHTGTFRKAERRFEQWEQVQAFLKGWKAPT